MMEEPIVRQVREEVFVLLQAGHDRTAIRRAVRLQVTSALGTGELTAMRVQQIAHATMQGAVQAAEQADQPLDIAGAEASEGLLDAVRETGGRATQYLKDAVQGGSRLWRSTAPGSRRRRRRRPHTAGGPCRPLLSASNASAPKPRPGWPGRERSLKDAM
jgi:hypothetical protein